MSIKNHLEAINYDITFCANSKDCDRKDCIRRIENAPGEEILISMANFYDPNDKLCKHHYGTV